MLLNKQATVACSHVRTPSPDCFASCMHLLRAAHLEQGHRQLLQALGELRAQHARAQAVVPHQAPPRVLGQVEVLENRLRRGAPLYVSSSSCSLPDQAAQIGHKCLVTILADSFFHQMYRVLGFKGIKSSWARLRLAELLGEHGVLDGVRRPVPRRQDAHVHVEPRRDARLGCCLPAHSTQGLGAGLRKLVFSSASGPCSPGCDTHCEMEARTCLRACSRQEV